MVADYNIRTANSHWLIGDNVAVKNAYIAYYRLIYQGYTLDDEVLQDAAKTLGDLYVASGLHERINAITIDPLEYILVDNFDTPMFMGDYRSRNSALEWVREQRDECEKSGDDCVFGAPQRLLGAGGVEIEDAYVDHGFRITGIDTDITSFGVWAQDSYWGFWQSEKYKGKELLWEIDGFTDSTAYSLFDARETLFIAGGRNMSKPGTGTWNGLAVGMHKLLDQVRVGRSEIVVYLDASKVDVTISGLNFGLSRFSYNDEDQEVAVQLKWEGLDLTDAGSFHDPRTFGVRGDLDDAFATMIPTAGENYDDTANTIRGQFYGAGGREVTGVFDKNDIEGSFGAYREE